MNYVYLLWKGESLIGVYSTVKGAKNEVTRIDTYINVEWEVTPIGNWYTVEPHTYYISKWEVQA